MDDEVKSLQENPESSVYQSFAIPLCHYGFVHAPHADNPHLDHLFVGRNAIIEKLVDYLKSNVKHRGSYLIAGYRGSGKTSVVNRAIQKYRNEQKQTLVVNINLGDNSQLTALNIYFSIANILRDEIAHPRNSWGNRFLSFFKPTVSPQNILAGTFILLPLITFTLLIAPPVMATVFAFITAKSLAFPLLMMMPGLLWAISVGVFRHELKTLKDIDNLIERMGSEVSEGQSAALNRTSFNIGLSKQKRRLPINAREAEELLSRILKDLQDSHRNVVFVLDEIDKLSDAEELPEIHVHDKADATRGADKATKINTLLGSLKNFITTAQATFFFISGRETLDRYYSEKGSPNSLYESLFDQVIEVPSFLTDQGKLPRGTQISALIEEYVCRCIRGKQEGSVAVRDEFYTLNAYHKSILDDPSNGATARLQISTLRDFIYYLTFHSWGNPKRLSSLFESFTVPEAYMKEHEKNPQLMKMGKEKNSKDHWLIFNINHRRSFSLASEITTLFQHQLSRQVSKTSDKLTVSALSSLQFILKLHPYGFNRESLHRMSDAINIHRSPEFNAIVDDLLIQIFKSYMRRVRNGIYRYRFNSGFEQELRYISHVSDLESASYNFSLDSMKYVKSYFQKSLTQNDIEESGVNARHHITLGDMCAIEQSYNAASVHYCTASRMLASELKNENASIHVELLMQYVEVQIKHGDLEERKQNYHHAAAIYFDAERIVEFVLTRSKAEDLGTKLKNGDSKMDIFKQPFWAALFLSLKRSPRKKGELKPPSHLYNPEDQRFHLRAADLAFFLGDTEQAAKRYHSARYNSARYHSAGYHYVQALYSLPNSNEREAYLEANEREAYLEGNAIIGLVETTLLHQSQDFFKIQCAQTNDRAIPGYYNELLDFAVKAPVYKAKDTVKELLRKAAERFEANGLYISAAITHIKTISYYTLILDAFDFKTFSDEAKCETTMDEQDRQNRERKLFVLNKKTHKMIIRRGKDAIRCIDMARQLESSRSCKTMLMRDLNKDASYDGSITMLFEMLFGTDPEKTYPATEPVFWQNSLWAHKLASTLIWADFVKRKIESDTLSANENMPVDLSTLSVRSAILMRWIHARDLSKQFIDKKLNNLKPVERKSLKDFFSSCDPEMIPTSITLLKAYEISRNLYFAMEAIRIISRKNLDLVFPRMPQIYVTQWKLLLNLMVFMQDNEITNCAGEKMCSVRDYSLLLQKKLADIDRVKAPNERIPPSHFDYEHIYLRLIASLNSSINLVDSTSRTRTSIFHHKYYCHDDFSDPEFRMDYMLAHMFMPAAQFLRGRVSQAHNQFVAIKGACAEKVLKS